MSDQPNVLLITADHWPASLLGCAGHETILTPTLDRIAANGVRFSNCYAECPVCIPARRSLMTGLSPKTHDDRVYKGELEMPDVPTLAQTFRDQGYQAFAVGKLHVYPQRDRIGFDDVLLNEEGRTQYGVVDDYETYLGEAGYPGRQFMGGMGNNLYEVRPWHLPDETHTTEWTAREMSRMIKRRDPRKPGFYYCSFVAPHPPLVPLRDYLGMYKDEDIPAAIYGDWSKDQDQMPPALQSSMNPLMDEKQRVLALRAFYALCTHIDHQIRVVIGTLREEGLLNNTIIMFSSDHGDMLGDHGLWAKRRMYEGAANIPMILAGSPVVNRYGGAGVDERLTCWADVMPTLLDLAGVKIPEHVEGISMFGEKQHDYIYGEVSDGLSATRMIRKGDYKLVYHPHANVRHLFDVVKDPKETCELSANPEFEAVLEELSGILASQLYGYDAEAARDGKLVGLADVPHQPGLNVNLANQRGLHFPMPPA